MRSIFAAALLLLPEIPAIRAQRLGGALDCTTVIPVDPSPIRSPQRVHTFIAKKFLRNREVVEVLHGTAIEQMLPAPCRRPPQPPRHARMLSRSFVNSVIICDTSGANFAVPHFAVA